MNLKNGSITVQTKNLQAGGFVGDVGNLPLTAISETEAFRGFGNVFV